MDQSDRPEGDRQPIKRAAHPAANDVSPGQISKQSLLREFRRALANWGNLEALSRSPLADQVPLAYLQAAGCERGLALRQLLYEAI